MVCLQENFNYQFNKHHHLPHKIGPSLGVKAQLDSWIKRTALWGALLIFEEIEGFSVRLYGWKNLVPYFVAYEIHWIIRCNINEWSLDSLFILYVRYINLP